MSKKAERMEAEILFFKEDVELKIDEITVREWLQKVAGQEKQEIESINFIFCTDTYLLNINKEYLKHFDYTDVITFQYHQEGEFITGDIFISVDRVRENADIYNVAFEDELNHVMVHGLLHLLGYKDSDQDQKKEMREKEDFYLNQL